MKQPISYCRGYLSVPRLDPSVERVLVALVRGLRSLDIRFCAIGAVVPELLLNERPPQATLDADAVVFVPDLAAFERVKEGLVGFRPGQYPIASSTKAADAPIFSRTASSWRPTAY
jgi:hypothetical protein